MVSQLWQLFYLVQEGVRAAAMILLLLLPEEMVAMEAELYLLPRILFPIAVP